MKEVFFNFQRNTISRLFWLGVFMFYFSLIGSAHGDLDDRIASATQQIHEWPDSAELFVKRAELYLQHIEYEKALEDIDQSIALGSESSKTSFIKSKSQLGLGLCDEALSSIDNFLSLKKEHVAALRLKAKILFEMREFAKAADNFVEVISKSKTTIPENYIELSNAFEKSGDIPSAISSLELGMDHLGKLRTLTDRLIELHLNNSHYGSALLLQERLIESSKRKEKQLYKAAQICIEAKKYKQAESFLNEAEKELNRLPKHIRFNSAMRELKVNIDESFTHLSLK